MKQSPLTVKQAIWHDRSSFKEALELSHLDQKPAAAGSNPHYKNTASFYLTKGHISKLTHKPSNADKPHAKRTGKVPEESSAC